MGVNSASAGRRACGNGSGICLVMATWRFVCVCALNNVNVARGEMCVYNK